MLRKLINARTILTFLFALAIAYMTYAYLASLKRNVPVIVAKQDIKAQTVLTNEMIEFTEIDQDTKNKVFPHSFQTMDELQKAVAKRDIAKGTVLTKNPQELAFGEEAYQYLKTDGSVNRASFIPTTKRAITISVDAEGALNNTLKNGDFVDVIFTSIDNSTGGVYSSNILQHLEIIGIDKNGEGGMTKQAGKQNITLLVTPQEAVDLTLAKRKGIIDLVLNPLNADTEWIPPSSPLKFIQKPKEPAAKPPAQQPKPAAPPVQSQAAPQQKPAQPPAPQQKPPASGQPQPPAQQAPAATPKQ
ncbi:Flp pilus assembly protein CpaB [Aneurinibacillus sp. BA2021]|nr:Flp pilus assembly protein CpaB [Aneurinibacillus sp. BA2021]